MSITSVTDTERIAAKVFDLSFCSCGGNTLPYKSTHPCDHCLTSITTTWSRLGLKTCRKLSNVYFFLTQISSLFYQWNQVFKKLFYFFSAFSCRTQHWNVKSDGASKMHGGHTCLIGVLILTTCLRWSHGQATQPSKGTFVGVFFKI